MPIITDTEAQRLKELRDQLQYAILHSSYTADLLVAAQLRHDSAVRNIDEMRRKYVAYLEKMVGENE